jgi:hypothetical protein
MLRAWLQILGEVRQHFLWWVFQSIGLIHRVRQTGGAGCEVYDWRPPFGTMLRRVEVAAPSREGGGFRPPIPASRCPKPRRSRGEAVGPAPVGVQPQAGVRSPPKVCEMVGNVCVPWGPSLPLRGPRHTFPYSVRLACSRRFSRTRFLYFVFLFFYLERFGHFPGSFGHFPG